MNYILFYYGNQPTHLTKCLNTILSVDKDAKIYFCTNIKYKSNLINIIDFNQYPALIDKLNNINSLLKNTPLQENPLWATSLLRVHVLAEIIKDFNLNNFVHFDTDVLIYKSFEEINETGCFKNNSINITAHDDEHLVFGYSYFHNKNSVYQLENLFEKIFNEYEFYKNNYASGGVFGEMKMMGVSKIINKELFNELPTLPYDNKEIIFDPAGYGQYLDGSHLKRGNYIFKRRWVGITSELGKELKSKRILVKFKNQEPKVFFNKNHYDLANLHVHSKRLNKFLPKQYKELI